MGVCKHQKWRPMDRLHRQRTAAQLCHESVEAQTQDHTDHTFAGIMFDVRIASKLPFEYLEVFSFPTPLRPPAQELN